MKLSLAHWPVSRTLLLLLLAVGGASCTITLAVLALIMFLIEQDTWLVLLVADISFLITLASLYLAWLMETKED